MNARTGEERGILDIDDEMRERIERALQSDPQTIGDLSAHLMDEYRRNPIVNDMVRRIEREGASINGALVAAVILLVDENRNRVEQVHEIMESRRDPLEAVSD